MYKVCKFPSLYGTPWKTRFLIVALLYAGIRYLGTFVKMAEIRIINTKTDQHIVL